MICGKCGSVTVVKESRDYQVAGTPTVKRRRYCPTCHSTRMTLEITVGTPAAKLLAQAVGIAGRAARETRLLCEALEKFQDAVAEE